MAPEITVPKEASGLVRGALFVLASLAVLWTAYFAKPILAPMAIAVLLKFLLSPWMRGLKRRLGIPVGVSAALLVTGTIGGLVLLVADLAPAAVHWTEELPGRMRRLEDRLLELTEPVAAITAATEKVGEKVEDLTAAATTKNDTAAEPTVVRLETPSWLSLALGEAQRMAVEFFVIVVMLYLLLLTDGLVLSKLKDAGTPGALRMASALQAVEERISVYVTSLLVVHGGLGCLVATVLWLIGMPNPLFWGFVAGVGNAVPFIGPLAVTTLLTVVSLTSIDETGVALIAPGTYLVLHLLENNLVTPFLLGRWLSLSPVAIFVALMSMGFLWGVAGLLLGVPLLVALKITSEHVTWLRPLHIALDGTRLPAHAARGHRVLAI